MNKFETLVNREVVEQVLVAYGKYLLDSKITLSIQETMDKMNSLFTALTNDGYIMISSIDSVRAKLKSLRLIQSGSTARSSRVTQNNKNLITNSIGQLLSTTPGLLNDETVNPSDVETLKTYSDALATLKAIEPTIEARYKPIVDNVLKDLFGVYKINFDQGFLDLYIL